MSSHEEQHRAALEGVVDTLMSMFGDVMNRDAMFTVAEHCEGDLNNSIDAIMAMSEDNLPKDEQTNTTVSNTNNVPLPQAVDEPHTTANKPLMPLKPITLNLPAAPTAQPAVSYAGASRNTGAIPKSSPRQRPNRNTPNYIWTEQTRRIVRYHEQGTRVLILMRGVSGSGKSYLAKEIVRYIFGSEFKVDHLKNHVFSTDDFFMCNGRYIHNKEQLPAAHTWNQQRVKAALEWGLSPVFVDNTNVEFWEMQPYIVDGVKNGYIIEALEPSTPWAKKIGMLLRKNTHDVPAYVIQRKLDMLQSGVTGEYLRNYFHLLYPSDKVPPVLRNAPPVILKPSLRNTNTQGPPNTNEIIKSPSVSGLHIDQSIKRESPTSVRKEIKNEASSMEHTSEIVQDDQTEEAPIDKDVLKSFEEMERLEREWENGENWDENARAVTSSSSINVASSAPKPSRRNVEESVPLDKYLPKASNYNDWSKISMFMPPWTDDSHTKLSNDSQKNAVETKTSSTCMEMGDTDMFNTNNKIINSTPRDINFYYIGPNEEKIPDKRMLDKSTMTNENDVQETFRCKNSEKHFLAFRRMFKNVSEAVLRDIFDRCHGDVNWAVEIVLDGMTGSEVDTVATEDFYEDDSSDEQCECLAAYNIIPNVTETPQTSSSEAQNIPDTPESQSTPRIKKDKSFSELSLQLKRQIEQNVVISDNHYSNHCLKIRKLRRGEVDTDRGDSVQEENATSLPVSQDTTETQSIAETASTETDNDETLSNSADDCERTVNVNLGSIFVSELDDIFGRKDMTYPDSVVPRINMPVSLLNEINALWVESLMFQLEEHSKQSAIMVRQDEEFARALAKKEEELAQAGKEPEVPDLKEIMDLEYAVTLYNKEVTAGWKSQEKNDLAARMTREKLYNLFPDVAPDVLSELLMAHGNNFQATVEVLLSSTGNHKILEEKNGISKFVMQKEMERQEKILEEQNKALAEVQWPLLPKGEKVEMAMVESYRVEAEKHLKCRNEYYNKAKEYIQRGMTQVANYYSDVATLHKKKYEQANSLAAASLMQVHALNCTDTATIDLHYLHVAEAKESLDLFLDTHIQKLRESQASGGPRFHTLFFITGRGLHSPNGPRIKPAVKRRLQERGLDFMERNPGLLTAKVCANDKLTFQLT